MSLSGTYDDPFFALQGKEKESAAWAVGGRVGYLVTPGLLTYVDAGWTQAHFDAVNLFGASFPFIGVPAGVYMGAHTYNGWFVGGGAEYLLGFMPGLSWRTEFRFAQYQAADVPYYIAATGGLFGDAEHSQKDVYTVTTGLAWRFNWGGPVVSRY